MKWKRAPRNNISLYFRQKEPIRNAHTPSMWHEEFTLPEKTPNSFLSPFWTRSKPPHPQATAERMGKLMTTIDCLHFSWAPKNTKNKACDKLHYLVALPVRRQLLLERWKWVGARDREHWRMGSVWVGAMGVWSVKRATEMAGDEDGPTLTAITHVAWSYGPISTKTNYRRGNLTDRKNLSPSGTLPLRDFTQPLWASLRMENSLKGQYPTVPAPWWMRRRSCGSHFREELFCFHTVWNTLLRPLTFYFSILWCQMSVRQNELKLN